MNINNSNNNINTTNNKIELLSSNESTKIKNIIGKEPPPSFPSINLPKKLSLNVQDYYLLRKNSQLEQFFLKSPFYINIKKQNKDIERYSDYYIEKMKEEPNLFSLLHIESGLFPLELLNKEQKTQYQKLISKEKKRESLELEKEKEIESSLKSEKENKKIKKELFTIDLEKLEKIEKLEETKKETEEKSENQKVEEMVEMEEEEDDDLEEDDYTTNYFEEGEEDYGFDEGDKDEPYF
jgi:hypothetical protein